MENLQFAVSQQSWQMGWDASKEKKFATLEQAERLARKRVTARGGSVKIVMRATPIFPGRGWMTMQNVPSWHSAAVVCEDATGRIWTDLTSDGAPLL